MPFDLFQQMKYFQYTNRFSYYSLRCNTQIISGMQITIDSSVAIPNCAADARRAELLRTLCSPGLGAGPQRAETRHFRQSGNAWFCAFVYTKALLATFVAARFMVTIAA